MGAAGAQPRRRRHRRGRLAAAVALVLATLGCAPTTTTTPPAPARPAEPTRPPARAEPGPALARGSFAPVVEQVAPAVVAIAAERIRRSPLLEDPLFRRFLERLGPGALPPERQTSLGSGVIVDAAGVVVTNQHVVAGADAIAVVLNDGRTVGARIVRVDPATDLALLRVRGASGLPVIPFADSDALRPGDIVLALGNPFGIGQSVSSGIVSAVGRRARGLDLEVELIQTDAAINPGNSGGALVDLDGRLVGINTAILTRSGGSIGVGFAIPANAVRDHLQVVAGDRAS